MSSIHPNNQKNIFSNALLGGSELDSPLNTCLEERTMLLKTTDSLPHEQKQVVIDSIGVIFRNLKCKATRKTILQKINDIPYEQRTEVVRYAASFCENLTDKLGREHIVQCIIDIPQEQRSDVVAQALRFCQNDTEGEEKVKIVEAIKIILSKDKDDVLKIAAFLCHNLTENWTSAILRIIGNILAEQEDLVLVKAAPLCKHLRKGEEKAAIIDAIKTIPREERDHVLERTAQICQNDGREGLAFILKAVHKILNEQREDVMQKVKSLDQYYMDREISGTILEAALFFPAESLEEFIKAISKAIPKHNKKLHPCSGYYTGLALRENPDLREPLYQYLGKKLDSLTHKREANLFSRMILNCKDFFMIDEGHWLVQKALKRNSDSKWCRTM